ELARRQVAPQPSLSPRAELADDRRELFARRRQPIRRARGVVAALDRARVRELAQPRREHRAGDARDAALQLAKTPAAAEQLAPDQERPALAQEIERTGDRAELAVGLHARTIARAPTRTGTDFVPPRRRPRP